MQPLFLPGSWRTEQLGGTPLASQSELKPDGTLKSLEGIITPQMDADQQSDSIFVHIRAPVTSGTPAGGSRGRGAVAPAASDGRSYQPHSNQPRAGSRGPRETQRADGRRGSPSQGLQAAWLALGCKTHRAREATTSSH